MKILGIDIETGSSFDRPKEETVITEIGAVLWDTDLNCPVAMESFFVDEGKGVELEAAQYTGITTDMIEENGITPEEAIERISQLLSKTDRFCAHNGNEFDKPVILGFLKRSTNFYSSIASALNERNWIDTQTDIDYPSNMRSRSLIYLSACHGFVNPFQHRAVTDTLSMLRILSQYDINKVIENADSQRVRVVAQVPFDQKDKAKDAGFYWDSQNKVWFRQMRLNQTDSFCEKLDFKTKVNLL